MDKKYQLGDLRTIGVTLIGLAVLFGVGNYILGQTSTLLWTNNSKYPVYNLTDTPNQSKIFSYGQNALVTSSNFFIVVGLVVVAGIVIALISRAM